MYRGDSDNVVRHYKTELHAYIVQSAGEHVHVHKNCLQALRSPCMRYLYRNTHGTCWGHKTTASVRSERRVCLKRICASDWRSNWTSIWDANLQSRPDDDPQLRSTRCPTSRIIFQRAVEAVPPRDQYAESSFSLVWSIIPSSSRSSPFRGIARI